MSIVIDNSIVTGIHITEVGSHVAIPLAVEKDDSISGIDPTCMKVMFPEYVVDNLQKAVTYPKNPDHKRYKHQKAEEVLGRKVGNVHANLCKLFRRLLTEGCVSKVKCLSKGLKPKPSRVPSNKQKFRKMPYGKHRRGGGLVVDCQYTLDVPANYWSRVIEELENFLETHDGTETLSEH